MILDATCSAKRRWPAVADVRIDLDPSARPDLVADARRTPFRDAAFEIVYCDPPHLIGTSGLAWAADNTRTVGRFAKWENRAAFRAFLDAVNVEFARLLVPYGRAIFKLMDGSRSHARVVDYHEAISRLTRFRLISNERFLSTGFNSKVNLKRWGRGAFVHYLTFERAPFGLVGP